MKKIFIASVFLFFMGLFVHAAAPTASSSNLSFSSIDGKTFSGSFSAGNGAQRIVVMKEGSPVTGLPVNGVQYNPASQFGTAGTAFTGAGEFVISRSSWASFNVENLKPATTYYVAVFEFNGSGAATEYLLLPLTGSQATVSVPTAQATLVTSPAATGNTLQLTWTKGNGAGRTVVARKGAPVNAVPTDLTFFYADEAFGNGPKLGTDNFVVYKGGAASTTVKNLEPNTTYYFAVFEYNGASQPMHLTPGAVGSATTAAGPSVAATSVGFSSIEGNRMTIGYSVGNGTRRLIVARKGAAVTAVPVNGTSYTAGAFGSGTELAPGEFVVGNTAGTSVVVTSLEAATVYHFRVYEFDADKDGNTYYLTGSYAAKSSSTVSAPVTLTSNITATSINGNSASFTLTNGSGGYRTVLMKEGGPVDVPPADLSTYSGNNTFGAGAQLGTGNYVITWGMNGTSFTVSGLKPGRTYYGSVFEFNGYNYPVYSAGTPFSFTIPLEPTVAAKSPVVQSPDGGEVRLVWTSGNGAKRLVVAKKGSAPTGKPVDGVNYTANTSFAYGQVLAPDEYVVYNGDSYYFDLKNLEVASTYHYAVYEYNVSESGNADYLTSTFLASSVATLQYPTAQVTLAAVSNIQPESATINFTKGNGANRLFLMKEGSPVDSLPADYRKYNSNTYGTSASHMGNGNYVVNNTSGTGSFGVSNLKPKTTYYISAFEFNGANSPAYLRTPAATASFTTSDVPGATTPTVAASNGESDKADGNKLTLKWTPGNGEKRIVVMRRADFVNFVPATATGYTANAVFAAGTDLGSGQYVVYNGTGNSVEVTGLQHSETYFATVYEYNGTGDLLRYLTTSKLTISASTVFAPATPVSNVNATTGNGKITLTWTAGDGAGRLIVMKEGSATAAQPVNLSVYPANAVFKNGSQMAAGEYVVYAGTGNTVTITGLENKVYHYSIFEFNGSSAPVYNVTDAVSGSAVVSSTLPVSLAAFTAKETANGVLLSWSTWQETNSSHFTVERSTDGSRFTALKSQPAAGNSTVRTDYNYTDGLNLGGKVYYRLQQADRDGKVVSSPVVMVEKKQATAEVSVYPNPVTAAFRVGLPAGAQNGLVKVYDANGQLRMNGTVTAGALLDAKTLGAGTYFIVVEANQKSFRSVFVKQ